VPQAGRGVAEGVQAAARVHGGAVGGGEDDPTGANGGGDGAGSHDAHADGAGTLIARTRGYRGSGSETGGACTGVADAGADLGAFEEAWKPAHGNAGGVGYFRGPAAVGDVEQQSAAGLLHVDRELTGQAITDVVLGAEDVGDAGEDFGLVGADPKQFDEREVGQRRVAGELDEPLAADLRLEPVALRLGALIAPDERGAKDFAGGVEHDAAVHLAGEPDGLDLGAG
jgi:hypothetical protein